MNVLKEMLQKNQILYFVLMTILVVGAIFTVSFSSQMAQWLMLTILTVISVIATILTIAFEEVVKQKYKTNVEQAAANQLEQFTQMKEALMQMQQQMQVEQAKHVQQIELKLNKIEETQVKKMKELQQTIELNKQLTLVKLTEIMTEQFGNLMNTTTSNFDESKQQLEKVQEEMDASFVKQLTQGTLLQKAVETMNTELVEHTTSQHEQARELVQQHVLSLIEHVNETTQQSIEQTTTSEKLLMEVLTTLARNVLTASNMMKDSLSKQHAESMSHIDNVDATQHKRVQQSFDALTERVMYVVDQLKSNSKAAASQLDEQTATILADLSEKYSVATTVFKDKASADQTAWHEWNEKSATKFNELTATIAKNVQVVQQQLKLAHDKQAVSLSTATQTIVDTVQASASTSSSESRVQFEQLQEDIQLATKQQEATLMQTGEMLQQEVATNFAALHHNISELQESASQKLEVTNQVILGSVNDLTALSTQQHEKVVAQVTEQLHVLEQLHADESADLKKAMLTQVISVGNDVIQGFEQLENVTSTQSNTLQTTITKLQQQLTEVHSETKSQLGQLHEQIVEVPKQQQQHMLYLQNALQQKMDEQLATSQNEWEVMKSQQVVQLEEARAFVQQQSVEQQRQSQQQQKYFTSIEKAIDGTKVSLQELLQKMDEQLTQLQKSQSTERQALQSKLQNIAGNVNELNAQLLQQLAGVKTEVSKNNVSAVQQQLKSFETQLSQLKTSITASKTDVTKQMQSIEQLVKKDEKSNPELKQILHSVAQITGQFKEHEVLMLNRIDVIDDQLKAIQQVSTSPNTTKTTTETKTSMALNKQVSKTAIQTLPKPDVKEKPENRTEIIEDKANGITVHNKYVNGVLKQSDMLQKGRISYTAFYNAKGVLEKTVNFDKNGKRQTEMIYYPTGAVKERIEYLIVKGREQKEITKFAMDGKRLN